MQPNDSDIRPNPDPTFLTTAQLDREIAHLKEGMEKDHAHIMELMGKDRDAQQEALTVAFEGMNRRLGELNELRKAVESDRIQFIKADVYHPAHEELRRQRVADSERILANAAAIKQNAIDLAELKSSMMWLSRLVIGALILAIVSYAFQKLVGR